MLPDNSWKPLDEELDRWAATGRRARLWLRDDDAIAATPALDRLLDLTLEHRVPLLLAVIPFTADDTLVRRLTGRPDVTPCQHGARHHNHAGAGDKAEELGAHRPVAEVLVELGVASERMRALFGATYDGGIMVPPWNRIASTVASRLAPLGFTTLSTFGPPQFAGTLPELNCDVDIMDWKASRQGHCPHVLVPLLCACLQERRTGTDRPLGVLTHHLAHGTAAWSSLTTLLERTARHPGAHWMQPAPVAQQA